MAPRRRIARKMMKRRTAVTKASGRTAHVVKALTVRQPFAALLVCGLKTIEARSWPTRHRGPLLIHAGQGRLTLVPEFLPLLEQVPEELREAKGALLGVVDIVECRPARRADRRAMCIAEAPDPAIFAWVVTQPRPLLAPLPCAGKLSLWPVPDPLCRRLRY